MSGFDNSVSEGFPPSVLYSNESESLMPTEADSQLKTMHKMLEFLVKGGASGSGVAVVSDVAKVRYDVPVNVSAAVQEVTVLAGAYLIEGFITNVTDENPYQLSVTDSEADYETLPARVGVKRSFQSAGTIILTEPLTVIQFPIGAVGVVSVMGPANFIKPVVTTV